MIDFGDAAIVGVIIITGQTAIGIGKDIIWDWLKERKGGSKNSGYCCEHTSMKEQIDRLIELHEEEHQIDLFTKVIERVVENRGRDDTKTIIKKTVEELSSRIQ